MTVTETTSFAVELDTKIAEQQAVVGRVGHQIGQQERVLNALYSSEATKEKAAAKLEELKLVSVTEVAKLVGLNRQYTGWERYYLVTNAGGHVHSSTSCSTCRYSTQFMWLTELSGTSAEALVEMAGERACTVCFPNAPVDVTKRPSNLKYDVEAREAKAKADAEKAAKAADKLAKAILPDGSELKVSVRYGEHRGNYVGGNAKTQVSARNEALRLLAYSFETHEGVDAEHTEHLKVLRAAYREAGLKFVEALAARQGKDFAELTKEFDAKAKKKAEA
jgi:hypothetical protein